MSFNEQRARKVELIILPPDVDGKSCSTCHNFDSDSNYCDHKEVSMNVKPKWGCKEWNHPGTKPAMPDDEKSKMSVSQSEIISRFYDLKDKVSRFSDCGHDGNQFAHGNTCGSLRGKNSFQGEEHHSSRIKHHKERISKLENHKKELEERMKRIDAAIKKSQDRHSHHDKMLREGDKPKESKEKSASKSDSMSHEDAVSHVGSLRDKSPEMDFHSIDKEIDKLSSMSTSEVKKLQKEVLGANVGKNKEEMINHIKKDIYGFRRDAHRSKEISKS